MRIKTQHVEMFYLTELCKASKANRSRYVGLITVNTILLLVGLGWDTNMKIRLLIVGSPTCHIDMCHLVR